jgi:hypothetical protein
MNDPIACFLPGKKRPPHLHYKHGAYYYVRRIDGKPRWIRLSAIPAEAATKYYALLEEHASRTPAQRRCSALIKISASRRFAIFQRDNFTCQYCGAKAPGATLHVDHIVPVARGGTSRPENLVTSCQNCNLGKSDGPLVAIPDCMEWKE